jgi:3-(3-hydroxy-phenyl)propionate hydroxylase
LSRVGATGVDLVRARSAGADSDAVPIRPDGHVAWRARTGAAPDLDALRAALATWFGPTLP